MTGCVSTVCSVTVDAGENFFTCWMPLLSTIQWTALKHRKVLYNSLKQLSSNNIKQLNTPTINHLMNSIEAPESIIQFIKAVKF